MQIILNGEQRKIAENINIKDLLNDLKIEQKSVAVAVNSSVVKREEWSGFKLNENDKVECLTFMGGG